MSTSIMLYEHLYYALQIWKVYLSGQEWNEFENLFFKMVPEESCFNYIKASKINREFKQQQPE